MTTFPAPDTSSVHIGVLAVQGDVREHIRTVEALGGRASAIRRPSELAGIDGLIIPGGESTAIDKLTRAFDLAVPLQELIASGLPVYGSCAGMIMLADAIADPATDLQGRPQQTLGGLDIVVRRNAFGRQRESFETELEFSGLPPDSSGKVQPVHAVFIRAPWVERVGPSVEVLAQVPAQTVDLTGQHPDAGRVARIVAVRSGNLLATSFHPEVTGERRIHELFMQMIVRRTVDHVGAL
ncbi:pyridoxal 5'-phosphate synthase glutaminase subunit PdxT [Arthrobacter flavus]|uniref:Pyridoxal 5'-phosphate synthase subunit PdxT n=1 Tax=Arthrobacter flavus TaxID=95172 RepID=A0ABW4QBX2_9MICC